MYDVLNKFNFCHILKTRTFSLYIIIEMDIKMMMEMDIEMKMEIDIESQMDIYIYIYRERRKER